MILECPKCGGRRVKFETYSEDYGDLPYRDALEEYEWTNDVRRYRTRCLDCGFEVKDWDQQGYREWPKDLVRPFKIIKEDGVANGTGD